MVRRFRKLGFDGPYSGGRHLFVAKSSLKVRIPNPHGGDISKSLVAEILRHAGISKPKKNGKMCESTIRAAL